MSELSSEREKVKVFPFRFFDKVFQKQYAVDIKILEESQASYSSYTWPSASILAYYLWDHRSEINGKHVLEIGTGTALPGLLAAKCGAFVTLSESLLLPNSIQNLHRVCQLNDLQLNQFEVIGFSWGLFSNTILKLKPVDLIIASDCFYEPAVLDNIIATIAFFLERNPRAEFLTTHQERSSDWFIKDLLSKWKLSCSSLNIDNLGKESDVDVNKLMQNHTIHLLKIVRSY